MKRLSSVLLLCAGSLAFLHCADPPAPATVSCANISSNSTTTFGVCIESSGLTYSQAHMQQQACMPPGVYAETGCPHAGATGGCKRDSGGVQIISWYYMGSDTGSVQQLCQLSGQTYVAP